MRPAAFVAAVLAWFGGCGDVLAQSSDTPVPACRLEAPNAAILGLTANEALRRIKMRHPIAADRITVNPLRRSPRELPLYVVSDARTGDVDRRGCIVNLGGRRGDALDPISVRGICVASEGRIFCSAGAISAVLGTGREGAPFLLFLLAHELTHIALDHPGAMMNGQSFAVDFRDPRAKRLSDLTAACLRDEEQIARETAADEGAFEAVSSAFAEPPFASGTDPALSLIDNAELVYQSYRRLLVWAADYYGATSALVEPGRHSACEVLGDGSGRIEMPELGGSHPHSWRRLGSFVMWTARQAVRLGRPPGGSSDFFVWQRNAMTGGLLACAKDVAVARFCKDVKALAAGKLDCTTARRGSAVIETDDDDLAGCGIKFEGSNVIPIARVAPMVPAKVLENPAALFLRFGLASTYHATREKAQSAGLRGAEEIARFLRALTADLSAQGGYLITHDSEPVSISHSPFSSAFSAGSRHSLIAAVPSSFNIDKVNGYNDIKAHYRTEAAIVPWRQARYMGILHYHSDPTDTKRDSKRVLTVNLPLDFFYDIGKARSGIPGQIGPEFARLFCYARERLRTRWPGEWTFEQAGRSTWAFYLSAERGNWYFPQAWGALTSSTCPAVRSPDRKLRALLARAYDYGQNSDEIPSATFDAVFGTP